MNVADVTAPRRQTADPILMAEAVEVNIHHVAEEEGEHGMLFGRCRRNAKNARTIANETKFPHLPIAEVRPPFKPFNDSRASRNRVEDRNDLFEGAEFERFVRHGKYSRHLMPYPYSPRTPDAPPKRVADGQPLDHAPILHVLGEQRVTAGFQRGGDDERIVEREIMIARQSHAPSRSRARIYGIFCATH